MTTYVIDLHDRPGSLERLLNTCRRKRFHIRTLQFGPGAEGLSRVALELEDDAPPADRVIANLVRVHDVVAAEQVSASDHAAAADATLRAQTHRAA